MEQDEQGSLMSVILGRLWRVRWVLSIYVAIGIGLKVVLIPYLGVARDDERRDDRDVVVGGAAIVGASLLLDRGVRTQIGRSFAQILASVLIGLGLTVIATVLSDSAKVGRYFCAGAGGGARWC